jgi:Secretion system C-terminal sorting domain
MKINFDMKYNLLALFFSLNILSGYAQVTITITPQVQTVGVNPDSTEIRAKATFKNTSTVTKKFTWSRNVMNITTGWITQVCDSKGCWIPSVGTAPEQIELAPNATSNLDVYIRPEKKQGAATIEVKVFEVGNETNTVTGRYLFSTTTRAKETNVSNANIRIYPNPTIDYFQITEDDGIDKVVIYNIIGRQMRTYKVTDNGKYNVNDLPEGLYIIRLLASNGSTVKTIRLSRTRLKA